MKSESNKAKLISLVYGCGFESGYVEIAEFWVEPPAG
jgi:hypothetical protein